jgi:hypothetical protein
VRDPDGSVEKAMPVPGGVSVHAGLGLAVRVDAQGGRAQVLHAGRVVATRPATTGEVAGRNRARRTAARISSA